MTEVERTINTQVIQDAVMRERQKIDNIWQWRSVKVAKQYFKLECSKRKDEEISK